MTRSIVVAFVAALALTGASAGRSAGVYLSLAQARSATKQLMTSYVNPLLDTRSTVGACSRQPLHRADYTRATCAFHLSGAHTCVGRVNLRAAGQTYLAVVRGMSCWNPWP